uniref:MYB family transcription factor n=1 Tax=Melilotus albus TaxID=47082 RepID=A0A896WAP2_MELAB|nr:MYB family transcription factor [Melilotus albus]
MMDANKEKQQGNEESSPKKEKQQGNEESSMKEEKQQGNEESSMKKEKQQDDEKSSTKKERHIVSWTQAEDDILREQIRIHGTENWAIIASKFNGKTTRQCRRRWYTYLNANFKKDGWTPDEDMLLSEAQKVFGNKWTEIAKVVSGRTDNAVKNRFSTLRKKREKNEKNEAIAKERIIPCIASNTKRNISHQGYNTGTTSESAVPVKKISRRAHIPDDAKEMNFGDRSHLRNAILINQQPRAPFAELAQKSNNVNNVPDRHHVSNDKFNSSGQNNKYELKKDDPKIRALIQIMDSGNMERVWKPLLEYLNKTDIIGEKIAVLQLVSNMVKELKSSNERGNSRLRKMELDKSSEYRTGLTLLPKSTGTGDNLESSSNQDIGTEMKATHKSTGTRDNLESSLNQDIGTEMKAIHKSTGAGDNLESSSNQDIGTEMKATQFGVEKEVCEGVEEVLSTGKVAQDMILYSEEQINASSRMEGSPLQVTPIFRSLGEGIPTPEFTDSEKNFLRKTLGVESPSHSPYKLSPCIRALRDDPRFI